MAPKTVLKSLGTRSYQGILILVVPRLDPLFGDILVRPAYPNVRSNKKLPAFPVNGKRLSGSEDTSAALAGSAAVSAKTTALSKSAMLQVRTICTSLKIARVSRFISQPQLFQGSGLVGEGSTKRQPRRVILAVFGKSLTLLEMVSQKCQPVLNAP